MLCNEKGEKLHVNPRWCPGRVLMKVQPPVFHDTVLLIETMDLAFLSGRYIFKFNSRRA